MTKAIRTALFAACALLCGTGYSQATVSPLSDSLKIFNPDGSLDFKDSVFVSEVEEQINGASHIYTSPIAIDPTQFGNPIVLAEPGVDPAIGYSDIVGIATINNTLFLSFASDTDTQLVNFGPFEDTILEKGPVNVTQFLSPELRDAGYKAVFTSDVPEPAVWASLLVGFGALGFMMRRTRIATAASA